MSETYRNCPWCGNSLPQCERCGSREWLDLGQKYPTGGEGFGTTDDILRCSECSLEVTKRCGHIVTKERTTSIPRLCPRCSSNDVEFYSTEPDVLDYWRCRDCGQIYSGKSDVDKEQSPGFRSVQIGGEE